MKVINVTERGALTLPKEARDRLGVSRGGTLLLDYNEAGDAVLRAGVVMPVEVYSDERIAGFEEENEAPLAGRRLKWRKVK